MGKRIENLWRTFRFPLIVAFGTLPILLLVIAWFAPDRSLGLWLWPVGYVLLDALGTRVRGKWRILYGTAVFALIISSGWYILVQSRNLFLLILPVVYIFLMLCGLRVRECNRNEQINPLWYQSGVIIHLLVHYLLYRYLQSTDTPFSSVIFWMKISFFLFAALVMVTMNQQNLFFATGGRQKTTGYIKKRNLLLTLILFGMAAFIALIPSLGALVGAVFRWMGTLLLKMIGMLGSWGLIETETGGGRGLADIEVPGNGTGDSFFRVIAVIVVAMVVLFLVLLSGFVIFRLLKKIPGLLWAILEAFGRTEEPVPEGYIDEIIDTREENGRKRRQRVLSQKDEKMLPPDQRIRYRYLRLMQKHPEWDCGSTARENLSLAASLLYERVRYGDCAATEEDALLFAAETQNM